MSKAIFYNQSKCVSKEILFFLNSFKWFSCRFLEDIRSTPQKNASSVYNTGDVSNCIPSCYVLFSVGNFSWIESNYLICKALLKNILSAIKPNCFLMNETTNEPLCLQCKCRISSPN